MNDEVDNDHECEKGMTGGSKQRGVGARQRGVGARRQSQSRRKSRRQSQSRRKSQSRRRLFGGSGSMLPGSGTY